MISADTPRVTRYCGRPVAIAMALVVASFSVTLAVSQWRMRPIEALALNIAQDAAPGIEHLDSLRNNLLRLDVLVDDHIVRRDTAASAADVGPLRRQLDTELEAFHRLPTTSEELAQLDAIEAMLPSLDDAMTGIFAEEPALSPVGGKVALYDAFRAHVGDIEASLLRLKDLDVREARVRSDEILRARRIAMRLTTGLAVASWIIAVIASLFIVRALRGHDRLLRDHDRLIAQRAAELEAFAGRVAHDLKNPLGALAMRVLLIARRRKNEGDVSQDLNMLIHQVQRMDQSVDGMLEFARAGANPAPGAHTALNPILTDVLEELRPAVESAGIQIHVSPFPPTQLACTSAALTSVLSNLLGNAVKYCTDGTTWPPQISIRVKDQNDGIRVEIADTGPGLPSGAEKIIFEPFRRLSGHHQPGIGLGLATVNKIVQAYKGRVGVSSTLQRGSVFWVELPKPTAECSHPADQMQAIDSPAFSAGVRAKKTALET